MNPAGDSRDVLDARTTVLLCMLAALCEGLDLQAAGVAAAGIVAEYQPSPGSLGTFFSASTIGLFIGALSGGRLSDSIGRKTVLVASIIVFGVFSLLTPLAPDMFYLTGMRLITGLGLGGALPNILALVSESARPDRRKASVALVYCGTPIGGGFASAIALLSSAAHWRWVFMVGGVIPLILAPIMMRALKESASFLAERAAAEHGDPRRGATSAPRQGSFAAILGQGRAPRTLLLWISFFLALLTLYLLLNWLPTLLVGNGFKQSEAASAQIGFNLGGAAAGLLMARMLETRWKMPSVILAFIALPLLMFVLAKTGHHFTIVMVIVCLLGGAVIAVQAFLYATAPMGYPVIIRGVGVGAAVAVGRLGSIAGPLLGGVLKGAGHTSSRLLMDILPIVVAGSVFALILAFYSFKQDAAQATAR